jgi:ethanolaminephosphotransferase
MKVTLLGTLGMVFNFFVVSWLTPTMQCEGNACPRYSTRLSISLSLFDLPVLPLIRDNPFSWIYLLSAVALWFYQTMDNLDGRQARRTKSSSPLGQLFDHGCDALVTVFVIMNTTSLFQVKSTLLSLNILMLNLFVFWLATWEEYHTDIFILGYINGPEEGIVLIYTAYLVTFFTGGEIWVTSIRELFRWTALPDIPLNEAFAYFTFIPSTFTCCVSLWRVFSHLQKTRKSFWCAISHLLTFGLYAASVYAWYYLATEFWTEHSRLLQLICGILFGELAGRLIVAHLCRETLPLTSRPLYLFLLPLINSFLVYYYKVALFNDVYISLLFSGGVLLSYGHFVYGIVTEICVLLGIHCFKLKDEPQTNGLKVH